MRELAKVGLAGLGCLVVLLVLCAVMGSIAAALIPSLISGPAVGTVDLPGIHLQGSDSGGNGMIAAVLSLCIPLVALLGVIFLTALWLLKGKPSGKSKDLDADDARMIQEIYHGLIKMEERVEALETLLLDRQGKGKRS